MDGKAVLDQAEKIISRGDVDRVSLLFHMNSSIRNAFRAKSIFRLQGAKSFAVTAGVVACPTLKLATLVRHVDSNGNWRQLAKIPDIKQLYVMYADPTASGTPAYYNIQGQSIQVVPAPINGTILIAGEFWPVDLSDNVSSTNLFSDEIPDFLVNYGVAEYLDFMQEEQRGQYYRGKALTVLGEWIKEGKMQEATGVNNMPRDPLGNLGYNRRTKAGAITQPASNDEEIIDDAGVW